MKFIEFSGVTDCTEEDVKEQIEICQNKNHVQQVAYSTYHQALTQICFTCKYFHTTMPDEVLNPIAKELKDEN